jgi:protein tyrosine phosphatase (PTP) superfamily phosphohydrolase (DUF442 family)
MTNRPVNYFKITANVATSGQPDRSQFFDIADDGYQVVINLAVHDSENALPDEGNLVTSLGMYYINIPVPFDEPTLEHLRHFAGIMQTLNDQQVWVHCEVNARVSAFMYQYLTQVCAVEPEAATSPLLKKWRERMDDVWQAFLTLKLKD